MSARQQQEGRGRLLFDIAMFVAVVGAAAALWARLPSLPVLVGGLTVAGAAHPPPVLTGIEGSGASRRIVPATPAQRRAVARHVRLSALRTLALPVGLRPARVCALAGLGAGVSAHCLAVVPPDGWPAWLVSWGPWANAVSAFVLVTGAGRVWRTTLSADEPGPGTPLAMVAKVPRWALAVVLLGGAVGWAVAGIVAEVAAYWVESVAQARLGGLMMGAACAVWATCRRSSWEGWRRRERARHQWEPRWTMVPKEEQPPVLVDRLVDGPLTVDTFRARPGRDLAYYVKASERLAAAVGDGSIVRVLPAPVADDSGRPSTCAVNPALFRVAVLDAGADETLVGDARLLAAFQWAGRWARVPKAGPAPVLLGRSVIGPYTVDLFDAPGRPSAEMLRMSSRVAVGVGAGVSAVVIPERDGGEPGTIHPTRFRVASCTPGTRVDVSTASLDEVRICIERFLTGAADHLHRDTIALRDLSLLTSGGPQVWRVDVTGGATGQLVGFMEQIAPALLDGATIILGDAEGASWAEAGMAEHVADLRVASEWSSHFGEVIKTGDVPPVPQAGLLDELDAGGVTLHRLPFASPQGKDIARDYLPLGQRLRTTMPQAPFLLITAIAPTEGVSAPGTRSDKFFEVVWSEQPVAPGPAALSPSRGGHPGNLIDPRDGATLVLAGMVDAAFRSVFKDDKVPQTVDAGCLTVSAPWIWRVRVRLYGGLSLVDLRAKIDRIAALMRVEWIRLRADGELVEIFVGAPPVSTTVAPAWTRTVAELDFEQAWASAGTVTRAGEVPTMVSASSLDGNDEVSVYTFSLPPGLSGTDVKDGIDKVASTIRAGFLQVVAQPDPSRVVLMSAAENPVPRSAAYDFDAADTLVRETRDVASTRIPWGIGVDGRPVVWDVEHTPHVLVLGITGTGKSVALTNAIYAAVLAEWDVIVIDPVKGGADFAALSPWLRGLGGGTLAQAEAMMRAVYAEVRRRKALAAKHGVPGIDRLPSEARPPHVLVTMDEFTSLILLETVHRARTNDPDVLAGYERADHENAQKASIGSLAGRIAREARSTGVHLALGTQVLKADTITRIPGGDLKNNLGRLLLGMPTPGERMSGLRRPELAPTLTQAPIGRGVWEATTSAAVEVQSWFAEFDEYAAQLASRGAPARDDWDVSAFMPKEEAAAYTEVEIAEANGAEMLDELVLDDLDPVVPEEETTTPDGPAPPVTGKA